MQRYAVRDDQWTQFKDFLPGRDGQAGGRYLTVGSPIKFSDMTVEITGSPLLGEHTNEVLAELGYSKDRIAALHTAKAVSSKGVILGFMPRMTHLRLSLVRPHREADGETDD